MSSLHPPPNMQRAKPARLSKSDVKALVRFRDGYRCRLCGIDAREHLLLTGRDLEVHRLQPGSRYTVKGCITVCKKCHGPLPKSPATATPNRRNSVAGIRVYCHLPQGCEDKIAFLVSQDDHCIDALNGGCVGIKVGDQVLVTTEGPHAYPKIILARRHNRRLVLGMVSKDGGHLCGWSSGARKNRIALSDDFQVLGAVFCIVRQQ